MAHLFISYSREELTFVDSLSRALEKAGHIVWIDYLLLVPGRGWQSQIFEGIEAADKVILVVSPASLSSESVQIEWQHALRHDKPVILILFAGLFSLPSELRFSHWIDFQQSFSKALSQLFAAIQSETRETPPPIPVDRDKMPPTVACAYYLSFPVALLSLFFVLPAFRLLALPNQIRNRTYNYNIVRLHLGTLILSLGLLSLVFVNRMFGVIGFAAFVISTTLLLLLRFAPGLYRWAGPGGVPVAPTVRPLPLVLSPFAVPFVLAVSFFPLAFTNVPITCFGPMFLFLIARQIIVQRWLRSVNKPRPVTFAVDYDSNDYHFVDKLIATLSKRGHKYATVITRDVDCVFVVLSRYHRNSNLVLENAPYTVYPLIFDDVNSVGLAKQLTRFQWLDLRRIAPIKIKLIAQWVHDPQRLREHIAVPPNRYDNRPWIVEFTVSLLAFFLGIQLLRVISLLGSGTFVASDPNWQLNYGSALCSFLFSPIGIPFALYYIPRIRYRDAEYGLFLWQSGLLVFVGGFGAPAALAGAVILVWVMYFVILINALELRFWLLPYNVPQK